MKASILKHTTSELTVLVQDVNSKIESGSIILKLFIGKNNSETIHKLAYSKVDLVYTFDMSKKLPRSLMDMIYIIEIFDETNKDVSKKISISKKMPPHLSGPLKKIKHDFLITAKNYNGSKAYFFKKLPGEKVCEACWDKDLKASNNSNCKTCGGSGYIRYFANPYLTYCGPVKWANEAHRTQSSGKELASTTVTISALADFIMNTDDMIYYVKTGDFYRVISRTVSEIQASPVLQALVSNLVPSNYPDAEICANILDNNGAKI